MVYEDGHYLTVVRQPSRHWVLLDDTRVLSITKEIAFSHIARSSLFFYSRAWPEPDVGVAVNLEMSFRNIEMKPKDGRRASQRPERRARGRRQGAGAPAPSSVDRQGAPAQPNTQPACRPDSRASADSAAGAGADHAVVFKEARETPLAACPQEVTPQQYQICEAEAQGDAPDDASTNPDLEQMHDPDYAPPQFTPKNKKVKFDEWFSDLDFSHASFAFLDALTFDQLKTRRIPTLRKIPMHYTTYWNGVLSSVLVAFTKSTTLADERLRIELRG